MIERRGPVAPVRRTQALHTPAFLINGDQGLVTGGLAHLVHKRTHLIGRVDIAREKDESKGARIPKKRLFFVG